MIALELNGTLVWKVLVDIDNGVNVMYHEVFIKLGVSKDQLTPVKTPLADFMGDVVEMKGSITLLVEVGTKPAVKRTDMEFVVVRLTCAYNIILECLGIAKI